MQLQHHVLAARSVPNTDPTTNGVVNSDKNFPMHMSQAREKFSNTREGFEQQVQFQTGTGRAGARVNAAKCRRNWYWIGDTFQNIVGWPSGRVCVITQTERTVLLLHPYKTTVVHDIHYTSESQPPGRGPVPCPGINYTGPREILLDLITNLNVILYLPTYHTVHIIVLIAFVIMP